MADGNDAVFLDTELSDLSRLRERYRIEREKRIRSDGNSQYIAMAGQYSHFLDDPHTPRSERDALRDHVTVAIIGGGFAGLIAGARLKQAGIDDVRIIDKAGDFGGTWYWNRYPGAQCDVESYVYLPLLEETDYVPTEKYARAPEILEHCRRIGKQFGLYDNACLGTQVTEARWDPDQSTWLISTDRGDLFSARFLVMGNGPLNQPKLPAIPGIASFTGHAFHTSRWDYAYTGGGPSGGLTGLQDKRVAVIGTGATGVQVVPKLAEVAAQLYVFQRTPSSVDVRANRPTDAEWAKSLEPGWQKRRMENFTLLTSGGYADHDLVMDGWTEIIGRLAAGLGRTAPDAGISPEALAENMEIADREKMDQVRARVAAVVRDPATAEALKPWYRQFCKRPCFHDEYLAAFNEENVSLVDTDGKGIDRITETSICVGTREYPVDCIVFATGFEVGTAYTQRAGYDLIGVDGQTLSAHWAEGVRSLHGMFVRGFPNMFILGHEQGAFTINYPHLLEESSSHMAHILSHAMRHELREIEVSAEAEASWVETIVREARDLRAFHEQCTPSYGNNEGRIEDIKPGQGPASLGAYGKGPVAFFELLAEWRTQGDFAGLECRV